MKRSKPITPFRLLVGLVLLALAPAALAQGSYGASRSGLDLMDVDLMFIGAHPDDDGSIMATFARYLLDEGYKGTVVTLTGGEGGSNATGPELGRPLGLIREEEERRALALVGVDSPHWLGLRDFYFTLSAEETERMWGGDAFICDVVRLVRLRRPEVILTMWPGPGTHGNHQEAGRAATVAFDRAGDPSFCPEQITEEFLAPFTPLKLYYGAGSDDATVAIPTDDFSRSAGVRYADLKALAQRFYRTQGWDQFRTVPVEQAGPERFMLVRSRVPVAEEESHLLEGAVKPAGTSPAGVRLEVAPESYGVGLGVPVTVTVTLENGTDSAFENTRLSLAAPAGWSVAEGETEVGTLEPGASTQAEFTLTAEPEAAGGGSAELVASYAAEQDGNTVRGSNAGRVRAVAPVEATFKPLFDVAGYRDFAAATQTEWVIPTLPTRLPLVIGQANPVVIEVTNHTDDTASGSLAFELPEGVRAEGETDYEVAAGETRELSVDFVVDEGVLSEGRHAVVVPVAVTTSAAGAQSRDEADLYALPALAIQRAQSAPEIDGDLGDMAGAALAQVSSSDRWQGRTDDDGDSSATVYLSYDDDNLYVGMEITDQTVVCNIAPDDVRGFHRSDAVFISVDPSGDSQDTSTVYQLGVFPCTTEGFGAVAARDADADQGPIAQTAPDTRVASARTESGYTIEASIPWREMPSAPVLGGGAALRLNVTVFDGDLEAAEAGANIRESSLSWSAFNLGGKQFLPYLWPLVTLE